MRKSRSKKYFVIISPILVLIFLLWGITLGFKMSLADGGQNGECEDAQATSITSGSGTVKSYTTPSGETVGGVCIKSGTGMFGDSHSESLGNGTYESGCYLVEGVGTSTVTVTKLLSGSECKDISHLDVYYSQGTFSPSPTATASPTSSPTVSPEPSPTDDPRPTPSESPTPTPTETPEETPEVTPTPSPPEESTPTPTPSEESSPTPTPTSEGTSTPTPTSSGEVAGTSTSSDSNDDPGDPGSADTGGVQGQVLGASTLAATGKTSELLFSLGMILIGIVGYVYAAPKVFAKD